MPAAPHPPDGTPVTPEGPGGRATGASGPTATADPAGGWRTALRGNVLWIGLVSLLTDLASEMMNPLLPIFVSGLVPVGAAPVVLGAMEGLAEATASLIKLVSGRLSDRLGVRKPLVLLGYGLSTLARPAMALAGVGWHVVGLKFVDRVGKGLRTSPRDALLADAAPPGQRGLVFSFHRAMDHTGAVFGPLVAIAALYLLLGQAFWRGSATTVGADEMAALRMVFAAGLIPGLAAMACLVFGVRELAPAARDPAAPRVPLPRRFHGFVGVATLFALGNSSDLFLLLYARERFGLGALGLVALWVVLHVAKVVCSLPGGLLADRLGRRPAIVVGWTIYTLCYLGFALGPSLAQMVGLLLAYGLYYGLTEGALKAMVADFTAPSERATAFGVFHAAVGLAALPASLLFGVFWAELGAPAAFSIGAALAAVATVLLLLVRPPPRA
jgi:MFS family permease